VRINATIFSVNVHLTQH